MNFACVLHLLGRLCMVLAALLLLPLLVCLHDGTLDSEIARRFLVLAAGTFAGGLLLRFGFRMRPDDFQIPEAFGVVTGAWLVFSLVGALPFLGSTGIPAVVDAFFESVSGVTTTGASILPDPALLDRALLFWRATLHLVGGLGIVALSVAILPALGAGGNFLFQAEASGPEKDKLLPRISSVSKVLWTTYIGLTVATIVAFLVAGMSPFDAICHGFATSSTGGFSTRADSLASFSAAVQWTAIAGMLLGGTNYVLLLMAARGRPRALLASTEWRTYLGIVACVTLIACAVRFAAEGAPGGAEELLRSSLFSTAAVITTTGFATVDYGLWAGSLKLLLIFCMLSGACAGSTSGGHKVIRLILYWKVVTRELRRLIRPSAVVVVRVQSRVIPDGILLKTVAFLAIFLLLWGAGSLALLFAGVPAEAAISGAIACLTNVGPAFGELGPSGNYSGLGDGSKALMAFLMLAGRLEFFALFVLLSPQAWRR